MTGGVIFLIFLAFVVLLVLIKTAIVVPQQSAYVVERLGRYAGTLDAGFHLLVPFVDAFLVRVDVAARRIDLDLPPGLVDVCAST